MHHWSLTLIPLAAFALGSCATPFGRAVAPKVYANPVLDADFPDPAVVRAPDGYYYAYGTQGERNGKWNNIQLARSADLVTWEHVGDALPAKPEWASKTQEFWSTLR